MYTNINLGDTTKMADNNFKPAWNVFSMAKLRLYGERWENKKSPSLLYTIHNNNPRFRVYMNDDKVSKPIAFALDPYILEDLLCAIEAAIRNPKPSRNSLEIKSSYDHHGNKTDKPATVSKIIFGRDTSDVCYIAFQAKGEEVATFPFTPSYYAVFTNESGETLDKSTASEYRGQGWVNTIRGLTAAFLVKEAKEPPKKDNAGGGYGGGNSGGNSGGNKGGWDSGSEGF